MFRFEHVTNGKFGFRKKITTEKKTHYPRCETQPKQWLVLNTPQTTDFSGIWDIPPFATCVAKITHEATTHHLVYLRFAQFRRRVFVHVCHFMYVHIQILMVCSDTKPAQGAVSQKELSFSVQEPPLYIHSSTMGNLPFQEKGLFRWENCQVCCPDVPSPLIHCYKWLCYKWAIINI